MNTSSQNSSRVIAPGKLLIIFIFVLAVTYYVTRFVGNYQKNKLSGSNINILETMRIANNKYIQIVRIGNKYLALAVCKDTVTMLTEIPEEELKLSEGTSMAGFKDILNRVQKKNFLEKEDGRDE